MLLQIHLLFCVCLVMVPLFSIPAKSMATGSGQAQPQHLGTSNRTVSNRACTCEDTIGDACSRRRPCCSPLECQFGRCINRQLCVPQGAVCPLGPLNCCALDTQSCLVNAQIQQYTCQNCVQVRISCSIAVPPGFPSSCCPNSACLNLGFGFFCYPTRNTAGLAAPESND